MSQDYISALFDGLFFILAGLILLGTTVFESYAIFQENGLITAMLESLPGLGWSAGSMLLGYLLYHLSSNSKQPLVFDRYS